MDFVETQEQLMLRQAIAEIAAGFGHEYYAERGRRGEKVEELWEALAGGGFVGVNIPEQFGGGGMGIYELAIVCEELAAQGLPLLILIVSPAIAGSIIARFGTDGQQQAWLPGLATGERRIAFAITEPDAGSNSHRISTTAKRDGDVYRLNGQKYYISAVDEADQILVVTRTGVDETTGNAQLSLFVVDVDTQGLTKQKINMEMVSPENQYTLFFDNAAVPADRLVGTEGDGLRQVFQGLNPERITGAAIGAGIGRYALDKAADYARQRKVWDVPIGAHQGIAHPLAKAKVEVELAKLMTYKAAWQYDHGHDAAEAANMAKYAAGEAALEALDHSIQTHGGNGLASEYGLADMWGNARLLRTAPISREMILNFVAQHSLGLPKSY
ncbi:MAG: acyl-CoA/acyl-ACP dehydrogenase [Acidimicrobiia bacterium]|nr:acyl-CoA/acyl-ACP dehydrogenase [Acidimicrobiia bacterium]